MSAHHPKAAVFRQLNCSRQEGFERNGVRIEIDNGKSADRSVSAKGGEGSGKRRVSHTRKGWLLSNNVGWCKSKMDPAIDDFLGYR